MKKTTSEKITRKSQRMALKAQYLDKFGTPEQRQAFSKKRDKQIQRETREDFRERWKKT